MSGRLSAELTFLKVMKSSVTIERWGPELWFLSPTLTMPPLKEEKEIETLLYICFPLCLLKVVFLTCMVLCWSLCMWGYILVPLAESDDPDGRAAETERQSKWERNSAYIHFFLISGKSPSHLNLNLDESTHLNIKCALSGLPGCRAHWGCFPGTESEGWWIWRIPSDEQSAVYWRKAKWHKNLSN